MQKYASIKYDIAFKRVFTKLHILKAFLNTVLAEVLTDPIAEIELKPTDFIAKGENRHVIREIKHTVIDVFCIDEKGRRILVELQKGSNLNALARFLDYQCRNYSSQFEAGAKYDQVVPCYSICWLFDIQPPHNLLLEQIHLQSNAPNSQWLFEWQILALYPKNLDWNRLLKAGTQAELEQWLLLDVVTDLDKAKKLKSLIHDTHISEAFEQLDLSAYTEQQLKDMEFQIISEEYPEQLQKYMEKQAAKLVKAKEKEMAKLVKAKEKEVASLVKAKEKEMVLKLAKSLLGVLDVKTISEKTGLSIAEIEQLK